MNQELLKKMNKQINMEYFSAFLYLAMAEWLLHKGYVGASHWMAVQYREEVLHAEGFFRYLQRIGEKVELEAIEKPKQEWNSLLEVFQEALEHEQLITRSIYEIVDEAKKAGDYAAERFLDWYVMEQVEEEQNQNDNILGVERAKDDVGALLAFDTWLGKREFGQEEIPYLD